MSIYTSSTNRITGLSSGLDIDSMVDQLMTAESTKYNSYQQKIQKLQWQQESYREIINKILDFQDKYFSSTATSSSLRYSKAFSNYSSTVTNSDGIESNAVKVTSQSSTGTHTITVNSLATKSVYKGENNSFSAKSTVEGSQLLSSIANNLKDQDGNIMEDEAISFKVSLDGTSKEIVIKGSDIADGTKIGDVINTKLKNAFGTTTLDDGTVVQNVSLVSTNDNDRIALTYPEELSGHTLSVSSGSLSNTSFTGAISSSFEDDMLDPSIQSLSFKVKVNNKEYEIAVDDLYPLDEDGNIEDDELSPSDITSKISEALKKAILLDEDGNRVTSTDPDSGEELLQTTDLSSVISFSYSSKNGISIKSASNNYGFEITDLGSLEEIMDTEDINTHFSAKSTLSIFGFDENSKSYLSVSKDIVQDVISDIKSDFELEINDVKITIDADGTFQDMIDAINNSGAGVNLSYSTITNSFTLESSDTGSASVIRLDDSTKEFFSEKLGIDMENGVEGTDASIIIDGITTTRASNTISFDGVTMELVKATNGEELTITTDVDVDTTYENIKNFVDDYNELIESLKSTVTEKRTKYDDYTYYEPLTDAQKEEMDSDDIEKWETEAKKGILYNDTYISNLLSKMRSLLYTSVSLSDGSSIALYQIGITTTSDYSNGGKLEIDEDKLKEAIRTNSSGIQQLFTQSSTGLGDQMKNLLDTYAGSNGLLRLKAGLDGTITADENILSRQIKALQSKMSDEKDRLVDKENYYYELFSTMENAINNNNTQMDYITSMLGS